jgi:hypothetical protein
LRAIQRIVRTSIEATVAGEDGFSQRCRSATRYADEIGMLSSFDQTLPGLSLAAVQLPDSREDGRAGHLVRKSIARHFICSTRSSTMPVQSGTGAMTWRRVFNADPDDA